MIRSIKHRTTRCWWFLCWTVIGLRQSHLGATTLVKTLQSPHAILMHGGLPCLLRIGSDSGGNTNEIDYSVSYSSDGTRVRPRHAMSCAGRQANRPRQGVGVQRQEDRDEEQGRGRLPPVFPGGERVRGHHGRPEKYRGAPLRVGSRRTG